MPQAGAACASGGRSQIHEHLFHRLMSHHHVHILPESSRPKSKSPDAIKWGPKTAAMLFDCEPYTKLSSFLGYCLRQGPRVFDDQFLIGTSMCIFAQSGDS